MSREVRKVPANWQHPKNEDTDKFIPLLANSYSESAEDWDKGREMWMKGLVSDYHGDWEPKQPHHTGRYTDWAGPRPSPDDYMPDWEESECTHLMMYETTTEGTPISPAFSSPEDLAHWLASNGVSAGGHETATYSQWLAMINQGWAPSLIFQNGRMLTGVEAAELWAEDK